MAGAPVVSVVIAAYNRADTLPAAIESVRAQTRADWEIVVGDDASTDDTPRVLRALAAREPRCRWVRLPRNRGAGAARNAAIRLARGPWVAILDADDAWDPEKLERQLAAVESSSGAVWSYHGVRLRRQGDLVGELRPHPRWVTRLLATDGEVIHTSVLYRRDALLALGGFDETLRRSQDWDLFLRLLRQYGPRACVRLEEVLATYQLRPGTMPPHLVAIGRRCQIRVVARFLARDLWAVRHPVWAWWLLDGLADRGVEWATVRREPAWALWCSLAAVALAPIRRWRWRRALGWLRGDGG